MKNLGVKVTNYMDQAINKLETVLEQVDKGIGRTANALDLVEQDISTTVKKDLRTFRKGIKLFARLLNVVFTATFLLVLYLKFTQPDIYADLVRVMPAVLDTYVSQLPPWAGDAIDSLLDIVKKVLFWMQIYTQPTPKVGWYLPVGHHKKQGEPCFFSVSYYDRQKSEFEFKICVWNGVFSQALFLFILSLYQKNERRKQCISIIFNCVPFPWVQYQTVQLMQP